MLAPAGHVCRMDGHTKAVWLLGGCGQSSRNPTVPGIGSCICETAVFACLGRALP